MNIHQIFSLVVFSVFILTVFRLIMEREIANTQKYKERLHEIDLEFCKDRLGIMSDHKQLYEAQENVDIWADYVDATINSNRIRSFLYASRRISI